MNKKKKPDEQSLRAIARDAEARVKMEKAHARRLPPWVAPDAAPPEASGKKEKKT